MRLGRRRPLFIGTIQVLLAMGLVWSGGPAEAAFPGVNGKLVFFFFV